jgi:hypothetical protein
MRGEAPTGAMGIVTRPWFVLAIVVTCFGILTPKIFIPLFKQILGLTTPHVTEGGVPSGERVPPPNMRMPRSAPDFHHRSQHGSPGPGGGSQGTSTTGGSSSKSMLNFLLPVYAIGIGLYMCYTLFKVFNGKKKDELGEDEEPRLVTQISDSDFEESVKKTSRMRFKEKKFGMNPMDVFSVPAPPPVSDKIMFDAKNSEFKVKQKFHGNGKGKEPSLGGRARSEESEDELNDYAR